MKSYKYENLSLVLEGKGLEGVQKLKVLQKMANVALLDFEKNTRKTITLEGVQSVKSASDYWESISVMEANEVYMCMLAIARLGVDIGKKNTSYKLKHDVEKMIDAMGEGHIYISNGALIMALILSGKKISIMAGSSNIMTKTKFRIMKDLEAFGKSYRIKKMWGKI